MKRTVWASFLPVLLVAPFGTAAPARTTEFHKLKQPISADRVWNITLPDGYFLSGTLKDTLGLPLKGAFVEAANPDIGFGWEGVTDAAGVFSLPLQKALYSVYFTPPGSSSVNPATFPRLLPSTVDGVAVAGDTSMGEVQLRNGFVMSGKIAPPSGTMGMFAGSLMAFPQGGAPSAIFAARFGSGLDSTKYAMALPPGSYKLILMPLMAYSGTYQAVPMTFKTDKAAVSGDLVKNIKAPKGYRLRGTVKDSGKTALGGVLAVFQKNNPYVKGMFVMQLSVMKGGYSGYLPPGNYTLVFLPSGSMTPGYKGKAAKSSFDLVMPAADKTLNLVAQNGVVVSGKIVDARNRIVKSGGIGLIKTNAAASLKPADWIWILASTDSKGQYRLTAPPDTYDVHAIPPAQEVDGASPEKTRRSPVKTIFVPRRLPLH